MSKADSVNQTAENGENQNSKETSLRDLDDKVDGLYDLLEASRDPSRQVEDVAPDDIWSRFYTTRRNEGRALSGLQSYQSEWKQFSQWMKTEGLVYLSELSPYSLATHDDWVRTSCDKNKLSRREHLKRVRDVLKFARSRGWLSEEVVPEGDRWEQLKPNVSRADEVRDDYLAPSQGERILTWLENEKPCSRSHVLWILMYNYGLRISAIRALDRNHLVLNQPDDWPNGREFRPHLVLRDRPELGGEEDMGLPLKNKGKLADRRVPIRAEDVQVFDLYVSRETPTGAKSSRKKHEEPDKYDLHGLLTTEHSPRISRSTIEDRTAWLTCPTTYSDSECNCRGCREYREDNGQNPPPSRLGRHCEETRSPHQVRHGAITKMLDSYPPETVSKIVGTSVDEIKKTYDRADEIQRMNRLDWEN